MIEHQRIFWSGQYLAPDSGDPGIEPDSGHLEGEVTFTPVWDASVYGLLSDSQRSTYVKPFPFEVVDGQLMSDDDGEMVPGVKIPASVGGHPVNWVARFNLSAGGDSITVRELRFTSNPGGEVHLHNVIPSDAIYPQLPQDVVKGDSVTDIYAQGRYVVFIVGNPPQTKQYVLAFPGTEEAIAGAEAALQEMRDIRDAAETQINQTKVDAVAEVSAIQDQIDVTHDHIHQDVNHADTHALAAGSAAQTATTKALEAGDSAGVATTKASEASQSAADALTYRNTAQGSATTATDRAGEASQSALEALTSRDEAEGFRDESEVFSTTLAQRVETGTKELGVTSDGKLYFLDQAEVGVPLRVDTSVGTRVFLGDVMIYGDTGDRDLAHLLPEGWSATTFRLRRVGQLVTIAIVELRADESSGSTSLPDFIPTDFRPTPRHVFPLAGVSYVQINTAGGMSFISMDGNNIQGVIAFHTHRGWPTELPGVPGPGSSVT